MLLLVKWLLPWWYIPSSPSFYVYPKPSLWIQNTSLVARWCIEHMHSIIVRCHECDCVSMSGPRHSMSEGSHPVTHMYTFIHCVTFFFVLDDYHQLLWSFFCFSLSFFPKLLNSILVMHTTPRYAWCRSSLSLSQILPPITPTFKTTHFVIIIWRGWLSSSRVAPSRTGFYVVPLMFGYGHCFEYRILLSLFRCRLDSNCSPCLSNAGQHHHNLLLSLGLHINDVDRGCI